MMFILFIIIVLICLPRDNFSNIIKKKTILTYTCFLDFKKSNKFEVLTQSIDSILKHHGNDELKLIDKFVIINEYSDEPINNWKKIIQDKYPFVEFIQKNKKQRGQVYSLNMILNMIKTYDYWIHLEESWYCIRPFISDCIRIMSDTDITQLQINMHRVKNIASWLDISKDRYACINDEYCIIKPPPDLITEKEWEKNKGWVQYSWPLYSLQPSINRVKKYAEIGPMPDDPSLWPVTFEFLYGLRFIEKGNTKATLKHSAFKRDLHKHVNTYS